MNINETTFNACKEWAQSTCCFLLEDNVKAATLIPQKALLQMSSSLFSSTEPSAVTESRHRLEVHKQSWCQRHGTFLSITSCSCPTEGSTHPWPPEGPGEGRERECQHGPGPGPPHPAPPYSATARRPLLPSADTAAPGPQRGPDLGAGPAFLGPCLSYFWFFPGSHTFLCTRKDIPLPGLAMLVMLLLMKPRAWFWVSSFVMSCTSTSTAQVHLLRAVVKTFSAQLLFVLGIAPTQVQSLALGFLELHEGHQTQFSTLSRSLWMASLPSSLSTAPRSQVLSGNLLRVFHPTVLVTNKNAKNTGLSTDPWGHHLSLDSPWTLSHWIQ